MAEYLENQPDKSPLPIVLFLGMFVVYAVGTSVGLMGVGAFAYSGWNCIGLALILGTVLFLVMLFFSLLAIRKIANGTQRTAGIVWYLACLVLCLFVGVVVVPAFVVSLTSP